MITSTGRRYTPANIHEALSLEEIAAGLSATRLLPAGVFEWSVLQHALLASYLAGNAVTITPPHVHLAILVRRAPAAVLGLVPRSWSTPGLENRWEAILSAVYANTLKLPRLGEEVDREAAEYDAQAEAIAAHAVCPLAVREYYELPEVDSRGMEYRLLRLPPHELIREWLTLVNASLGNQTVRAMRARA